MRTAAALGILLAITIGVYWKLTLSGRYTWLENPDQAYQVRPWLDYEARELHAGRLPLWEPYQWAGQPLVGQVQPGLVNPFNWLLFAMPLRDGHIGLGVLHWYWVLIRCVAAMFCFWLCRDLGAGFWPSILGASVFAFTGFMGHTGSPQFLLSALWSPIILLFFARLWRGVHAVASAALCGGALGAEFLGSHHVIPIYTTLLVGGLWVWHVARNWRRREVWLAAAVFATVFPMVSAVQLLPAIEYGRLAVRWAGVPEPQRWNERIPYSVHAEYSLGLRSIPGMVIPGMTIHANPFLGIVALSLAALALVRRRKDRITPLLLAFALGGLVIALGKDTPVHRLLYEFVPMVEKAREPAMAVVLFQAGIAALAALGAAEIAKVRRAGRALVIIGLCLFLVETMRNPPPILRPRDFPGSAAELLAAQSDIADFLRTQSGWFRVRFDEEAVPYNFGDWHGIEQFGGYAASLLEKVQRVQGGQDAVRQFGVRYWVGRQPSYAGKHEVFASRSGLRVFEDRRGAQPAWMVHPNRCEGADRFDVLRRLPAVVVFQADAACPGLFVVGDPKYPGWRAWVDGRRVVIQEAEGVLRAVPLGAGTHRVEFRYRPGSVWAGAVISAFGLLLTGSVVLADSVSARAHTSRAAGIAALLPHR